MYLAGWVNGKWYSNSLLQLCSSVLISCTMFCKHWLSCWYCCLLSFSFSFSSVTHKHSLRSEQISFSAFKYLAPSSSTHSKRLFFSSSSKASSACTLLFTLWYTLREEDQSHDNWRCLLYYQKSLQPSNFLFTGSGQDCTLSGPSSVLTPLPHLVDLCPQLLPLTMHLKVLFITNLQVIHEIVQLLLTVCHLQDMCCYNQFMSSLSVQYSQPSMHSSKHNCRYQSEPNLSP